MARRHGEKAKRYKDVGLLEAGLKVSEVARQLKVTRNFMMRAREQEQNSSSQKLCGCFRALLKSVVAAKGDHFE